MEQTGKRLLTGSEKAWRVATLTQDDTSTIYI